MTTLTLEQKTLEIPPDLRISPQDYAKLLELQEILPPTEIQQLISGYILAQQKASKIINSPLKRAACVERNIYISPSTQVSIRRYAYFIQTKENRIGVERKLTKGLKHLPRLAGWWRKVLATKSSYSLPTIGDKEATLLKTRAFFGWKQGEWTLNAWWGRVPIQALWEYALKATQEYGMKHNPVYFAKCLHTAASLWHRYPIPKLWQEIVERSRRFKGLSRKVLIALLEAMKKALNMTGLPFGEWVNRFLAFPDGRPPSYYREHPARAGP